MAEAGSMSPVQKLRGLIQEPDKIILGPGVYDGLTARIALQAGFDCLYMVCKRQTHPGNTTTRLTAECNRLVQEPLCQG